MSNNINLLGHKKDVTVAPASRRLKLLRAIALSLLFGVSAASIILYILISYSALPQVQQQEQQALQSLSQYHPDMTKIALIDDRTKGIAMVLKQRTTYDTFLESIRSKMSPGMEITQISVTKKNATLTFKSNSLDELNAFITKVVDAAKDKKEYAQVTLNNILSDNQSNQFSLTVSLVLL